MTDDVWLPIDISRWREVPCLSNRVAREEDVARGRAVFFLENPAGINAHPLDVNVPRCAIFTDEQSRKEVPVLIIQVEQADDKVYVGYRICSDLEIELLDGPDARFTDIL